MSAQPECPYCGARLFPHEVSNDECGTCGRRISTAAGWVPPTAAELPRGAEPALTLPYRPPPEAFAAVRQGVNLIRWGVASGLVFFMLGAAGQLVAANVSDYLLKRLGEALWLFGGVFQVGSVLAIFLGVCFCCVVPMGCGARKWARCVAPALVVGGVLTFVSAATAWVVFRPDRGGPAPPPDVLVTLFAVLALAIVGLFASLCWFLLLTALARFFGDEGLAKSLMIYYLFSLLISAISVLGTFIALLIEASAPTPLTSGMIVSIWELVLCAWVALGVVLSLWLLGLLTRLHRLLPSADEPGPQHDFPPPRRWN